MTRVIFALASLLILAGCNTTFGGPPLVSGASPAAAMAASAQPQPINSLPPGAAGLQSGPLATAPNIASVTIPAF